MAQFDDKIEETTIVKKNDDTNFKLWKMHMMFIF